MITAGKPSRLIGFCWPSFRSLEIPSLESRIEARYGARLYSTFRLTVLDPVRRTRHRKAVMALCRSRCKMLLSQGSIIHCPTSPIASATHTLCYPSSYLVSINNQPLITRTDHKLATLDLDSLMTRPASVRSASA
jgi:hypothetical protein